MDGVPADDEVASLTARGGAPGGPDWPVAFTTTHWSVVLTAQDESPAAHDPLEELRADERVEMEPADPVTAELIYERRWASTVLERVLNLLKDEYRRGGNAALFDSLKELLPGEPDAPSQKDIAAQLGMTENAVRQAFYRFRQRYQSLLREEIAHTVATPGDIEDELRHLIAVVRA